MVKNLELHNQWKNFSEMKAEQRHTQTNKFWKNLWPSDLHYNKRHRKFFREKTVVVRRRQWHPTPVLLPGKSQGWGAWEAAVHGVAKSWTRLSDFTFTFQFHALEKEMATHFRVLAWRIPGMGEPDGLLSMGSHRVGHDWSVLAAATAAMVVNGNSNLHKTFPKR